MARLLFFLSMFSITTGSSFSRTIDDILAQKEIKKHNYVLTTGICNAIVINMQYGESEVISTSDRKALRNAEIIQVDVVFSDFPKEYDMTALNRKRIMVIQQLRKDAISNPHISWKLIRQMRCKNSAEAKTLFHGIVVHYREGQSEETTKHDVSILNNYLPESGTTDTQMTFVDSTVHKVLTRNKWNQIVVVSDLTGSMAPHVAQLILWFKLNELKDRVRHVTFFNDGDMTPDAHKKAGEVGGIYHYEGGDYEGIRKLAFKTVENGCGGDWQENDCEAILSAIEKNPEAKEIVLVADNGAPIRDGSLLSGKIRKPVRIVLCGTSMGVNIEYLQLAFETGGSVHTMEQDLTDLAELNEGKIFKFEGQLYRIADGKVVELGHV